MMKYKVTLKESWRKITFEFSDSASAISFMTKAITAFAPTDDVKEIEVYMSIEEAAGEEEEDW